jgi:hypothetical protein
MFSIGGNAKREAGREVLPESRVAFGVFLGLFFSGERRVTDMSEEESLFPLRVFYLCAEILRSGWQFMIAFGLKPVKL